MEIKLKSEVLAEDVIDIDDEYESVSDEVKIDTNKFKCFLKIMID